MPLASSFTLFCLSTLLIAIGYALIAQRGRALFVALVACALAYLILGDALAHGETVEPMRVSAIEWARLFARGLDGSSLFHLCAFMSGAGLIAAATRAAPMWTVAVAGALFGGVVAPMAAAQIWSGWLRSYGVFDAGGAIVIQLTSLVIVGTQLAFLGSPQTLLSELKQRDPPRVRGATILLAGLVLVLFGQFQLAAAASTMHAPTTVSLARWNAAYAVAAGFPVAVLFALFSQKSKSTLIAAMSLIAAALATSAGAGRLSPVLAALSGACAAVLTASVLLAIPSARPGVSIVIANLAGALIALAAAAFVRRETANANLLIQSCCAAGLAALALCFSIVTFSLARLTRDLLRQSDSRS